MLRRSSWYRCQTAATVALQKLGAAFGWKPDHSIVNFPCETGSCLVFRNAISDYDEELIIEELSRILPKEGQSYYADPTRVDQKIVRNVYLELFGYRDFTETKNWRRTDVKRVPGLAWSPTLVRFCEKVGATALGGELPDVARVVEHHLPGYEMHTEHPTVGRSFLYLNLMSDTVLHFDDEATQRSGSVYLPQRSLMMCSGELRWGWRFGEHPQKEKSFLGSTGLRKMVSSDMRLSIQLWKFDSKLVDRRQLQDELESAVREAERKSAELKAEQAVKALEPADSKDEEEPKVSFKLPPKLRETIMNNGKPSKPQPGVLGGELSPGGDMTSGGVKKTMADMERDMKLYKESFHNVQGVMKEMKRKQEANEQLDDAWIKSQMEQTKGRNSELDGDYNYDPSNPEAAWELADEKARTYKQKLKMMNYDDDPSKEAKSVDLGFDPDVVAPLDVKGTLHKLAPHMKEGEKLLQEVPMMGGNRGF